jgi:hypothetical protein
MTNERARIGFGDALDDLAAFTPAKRVKTVAEPHAAAAAGFIRREPRPAAQEIATAPQKVQRRRRTGRNVQINIKAKQETLEEFYAAVDAMGCGVGEAFEIAVELLKKKISES